MSIEMHSQSAAPEASAKKHKSKSDKKHKSSHSEKKRKRDHGEGGHRSKKHKPNKTMSHEASLSKTESPFHMQIASLFLPLAPVSQKFPIEGICAEHLSPLILTYYPPFNGVVLAYNNPRLSERPFEDDGHTTLLQNIDEYAVSWAWVTADFLLFKPEKGAWLEGYINLQNEGHLGLVCWNLFNASIERKRLPKDWRWVGVEDLSTGNADGEGQTYAEDGIGYYVDEEGNKIEGNVRFRVKEIESSHDRERGFLSIDGTMLDEETEAQLVENEENQTQSKTQNRDGAGKRLGGLKAIGATSLGVILEPTDDDTGGRKHRVRY